MGVKIDLKPGTDRKILGHVDQDGIQLETGEHVAITTVEVNDIDAHHAPVVKPDTTIIYEDRIGETNYNKLDNLPSINSIILTGNKTLEELGIQAAGDYAIKDDVPTKMSELDNDAGFITEYTETDPTVPTHVKSITEQDITNWNNKSSFSGSYNDLSDKPNIPTKTSNLTNDSDFVSDSNYVHTDNNFTDTEKTKLSGIETGAEKNKVTSVNNQIGDVVIEVPTKLSDLTNDAGFITGYTETDPTIPNYVKEITEKDIEKWNNAKTYTADDNVVIENDVIKGYTNTGYIVSDTDIKLQAISEVETMAETTDNKIVYTYDEVVIIYDGTNYIRRSENGIDFDIIELPYNCKNMIYHTVSKRLIATNFNGYFMYSDDNGKTWTAQASSHSTSNTYLFQPNTYSNGFAVVNTSTKKIIAFNENFTVNSTLTTTIVPNYICLLNSSQFIWCNNIGGFKYGAGAKEGIFPSLTGVSVSLLKNVNDKIIVGLNNNNKLYILSHNTVSDSSWVAYNLPKQCTVNDIIYNFNDNTYYILTSINTYYKTTDFVNFVSVDKDSLRGVQGYFTLAGIQATTTNNNKLLLAPTRIKIENMLQKFKRLTNFDKLLGDGLEKKSEEKIGTKVRYPISVSTTGVSLSGRSIDYNYLTEGIEKILKVSEAPITALSPTEIENYVWSNWDGTDNFAFKFMFTEAGTFYNVMSYEEEYTVEKYELGYVYIVNNGMTAPYTSMGKFGVFFQ